MAGSRDGEAAVAAGRLEVARILAVVGGEAPGRLCLRRDGGENAEDASRQCRPPSEAAARFSARPRASTAASPTGPHSRSQAAVASTVRVEAGRAPPAAAKSGSSAGSTTATSTATASTARASTTAG